MSVLQVARRMSQSDVDIEIDETAGKLQSLQYLQAGKTSVQDDCGQYPCLSMSCWINAGQ